MSNLTDFFPSGGGGLEGTQYVFVQANGTDVENAIELQAAYDLAITKIQAFEVLSAPYDFPNQQTPTTLNFFDFGGTLPVLIVGQTYTFNVEGVDMIGEVVGAGFQYTVEFPTAFTYNGGDVRVYVSESIKSIVIAAPGNYNFENGNFIMDTEYVDLVSLDSNRSIVFSGANTILISASNVFVKGVDVQDKEFKIGDDLSKLNAESCSGGNDSFGKGLIVSGIFTNCIGGKYSFGGDGGTASGTFTDCKAEDLSFGYFGVASGTFTNCTGAYSFGAYGTASGVFNNCEGGVGGFGGGGGISSGTFTNCTGSTSSFGSFPGTSSGTFTNCVGLLGSFGGEGGTASGTFTNCTGGSQSFGGVRWTGDQGVLSGKLYYCRLTYGTFKTVSLGGRTVLCIDGNNNQNNQ